MILLLEPNRFLATQYAASLKAIGYDVVCKQDAQSGIMVADEASPDLIIVELLLAGHSGVEFLYEFRSYSDWVRVPAIILSSVTQLSSGIPIETLKELGVSAYLYKPETSLEKINLIVRRLLNAKTKT